MNVTVLKSASRTLEAMRHATRAAHEALHVHAALRDLTEASVTADYYHRALRGFYGFHAPLEAALAKTPSLPRLETFWSPAVTPRLVADLRAAGIDAGGLPRRDVTAPLMEADAVAYLYLREGSALGGQLIARSLQNRLGLDGGATQFFAGIGKGTAQRWKQFCSAVETAEIAPDTAAASAAHLFAALSTWLGRIA